MTNSSTKRESLMRETMTLFARHGYDGFTMRSLERACNVSLSSIYHYFADKDILLKTVYDAVNTDLGIRRAALPDCESASDQLLQRIRFQFDNAEQILFVLRYYLHFRQTFPKQERGYLGEKAYRHISEVLDRGVASGEFTLTQSIDDEAKIIAHSINGFVLEYFPESPTPDEYEKVVDGIHQFMVRGLRNPAANAA